MSNGVETTFGSASASIEVDGKIFVTLKTSSGGSHLAFVLEPGPGRTYYAGNPIGVHLGGEASIPRRSTQLVVDPFKPEKGAHVRGTLSFEAVIDGVSRRGSGRFDAAIDKDHRTAEPFANLPAAAPTRPLAGSVAGARFELGTALALVWTDDPEHPAPYLDAVHFYADKDVGCAKWDTARLALEVDIVDKTRRGAQPAVLNTYRMKDGERTVSEVAGDHWISLDALAFEEGAAVSGTAFARTAAGVDAAKTVDVAGQFSAKVCRRSMQ
jgi:hypothetical protein